MIPPRRSRGRSWRRSQTDHPRVEDGDVKVLFHRLAAQEYEDVRDWYERHGTDLGDEFAEETDRAIARIKRDPYRCPV